ncbi:unnamed protein product [Closterium sp. NIES-65]|nr:unnamed protein product [Closterium sp. NIES-65]
MWRQKTISLPAFNRGCHLVTPHVVKQVEADLAAFKCGLAHIFIQHTSASLTINENCDRDVRHDMETYLSSHVPEGPKAPWRHTDEGYDDMPAHVKASLFGSSVTIPITDGRLNLGTWQGIWLCEHRDHGGSRRLVLAAAAFHRGRSRIDSSEGNAAAGSAGGMGAARALFGLFGGGKEREREKKQKEASMAAHADVPVPFSADLLAGTFLEGRELACCYRATQDGFSASSFHARSDFKGPVVVVALAPSPSASASAPLGSWLRFGAFNPDGYRSTDDYFDSFDAFLFYWPDAPASPPFAPVSTAETDAPAPSAAATPGKTPLKCTWGEGEWGMPELLRKVGGSGAAVFDYARGGPQFGADGLLIGPPLTPVMGGLAGPDSNSGVGDLSTARSRLGLSYEKRRDGEDSVFGEGREVKVAEVLVFFSPEIARLY